MPYHWEGDLIIQNTVMKQKRFVIGSQNKPIDTDIREWISFEDNNIMKKIVRDLEDQKVLPTTVFSPASKISLCICTNPKHPI